MPTYDDFLMCRLCKKSIKINGKHKFYLSLIVKVEFYKIVICHTQNKEWNGKTLKNVYIINESTMKTTSSHDGDDKEMTTTTHHKEAKSHYDGLKSEDFLGTFVDRKCSKCGHEGMTFSTR